MHPHIRSLVASLHTNSWFCFDDSDDALVVRKGGRQGCRFGSKIFNLAYAVPLKSWCNEMAQKGIALRVKRVNPTDGVCLFWDEHSKYERCNPHDVYNSNNIPIIDVEFVDDAAFIFAAAVPSTLRRHLCVAIASLQRILQKYGMTINWGAGKTEAMINFRGKRQTIEKQSVLNPDGSRS